MTQAGIDPQTVAAQIACVEHARDLVRAANNVHEAGLHHIAYHLAALALEELGKRELIGVNALRERTEEDPGSMAFGKLDSHTHKLFWAFFAVEFGREKITKESLEQLRNLAKGIHETRLGGLYVDLNSDGVQVPAKNVTPAQARNLIDLATTRLEMATAEKLRDSLPPEELEMQAWFLKTAENPETRNFVLGSHSMGKLAELKNVPNWVRWLREEFNKGEEEGRRLMQEELARKRPQKGKEKKRWKIRVRIVTGSHSIRPRALAKWNERSDWIKLSPVSNKKNELLIDFELLDSIPVQGLWYFGWGLARQFVAALNIGTMGFFWWRLPHQISRYYEHIDDIQQKARLKIERSPILKIDWGENRILTEVDLNVVAQVFVSLPPPDKQEEHAPYNFYIGGLTFLSLNDIHWQCEVQAFGNFLESLKAMMRSRGKWWENEEFVVRFTAFLDEMWPDLDERAKYMSLVEQFPKGDVHKMGVTLKEASFMKLFCDAFFLKHVRPNVLERLNRPGGAKGKAAAKDK